MTEKYSNSIDTTDPEPETEEEFLTDSESRDGEDFKGSSSSGGVALVMAVPIKSQSKPKMWLAAVDRKMMLIDQAMDRVAYWPNKPPSLEELIKACDERLKQEEYRKVQVERRRKQRAVSVDIKPVLCFPIAC